MSSYVRSKDLSCNNQQGFPPLFGLLSQQWTRQVLLESNEFTKAWHNSQQDLVAHQKVWPHIPFHMRERNRSAKPNEATIVALWDQLAKVDYFSPMLWKVDVYGNVLYRYADIGSLLSWKLDYHFPIERGGLSKPANMRLIQYEAHSNKADKLEFVLSREMVCTGLSLFDFRQAVAEHTMESLLEVYATQQHAIPLQIMPATAAPIDRPPSHRSHISLPRMSVSSQNELLSGMTPHGAAHAAAVHSNRLSSGSRRSISMRSQPANVDVPPTRIASSPRFSLHSDRAPDADPYYHVVEAMSQASLPMHHRESLHRRSSQSSRRSSATAPLSHPAEAHAPAAPHADPYYHVTEPMAHSVLPPRHSSSMTRLSRHSSRHSNQMQVPSAMPQQSTPDRQSMSSHRQSSQSSRHAQASQATAVSWDIPQDRSHAKLAAQSELYQSSSPPKNQAPALPQHPTSTTPHMHQPTLQQPQQQQRRRQHRPPSQSRPQQTALATVPASQPLLPAVSAAYMSGFQNGFQTGFQHGSLPGLQQYHAVSGSSGFALEAPELSLEISSSGELNGYTMMDTTFEQAQAWQSSLLEVTEVPPSEQGDEARSVASFSEPAVPAMAQRAEDAAVQMSQDGASPRAQHAVHAFEHAVEPDLKSAGMLPPEHQSGASPHEWLKLPDEAQEEERQQARGIPDSPRAIDAWLNLQQADCLASGRRLSGEWIGFGNSHALHAAASSTPSITPASSFESTPGQFFQAYRQQQPEEQAVPGENTSAPLASETLHSRLQQLSQPPMSPAANQPLSTYSTPAAPAAQQPSSAQQTVSGHWRQHSDAQQLPVAPPFAHWSSTPILGPQAGHQTGQAPGITAPAAMSQQAKQVFNLSHQPQHTQQPPSASWPAQHAQHGEQGQHSAIQVSDFQEPYPLSSPAITQAASQSVTPNSSEAQMPPVAASASQVVNATSQGATRPSDSWQRESTQEPNEDIPGDQSLLLTFAPVGSGELAVPSRQHSVSRLSPSSSLELGDSPDAASSQASAWAAFAPHRLQHVATPARRTLDFDAAHEPDPEHHSEPETELQPQPGPEPSASSQTVTVSEAETKAGSQVQHAQHPSQQAHQEDFSPEANDQPEAGAESEVGAPSRHDMAAQLDKDAGAPATPAQIVTTAGASSVDNSPVLPTAGATPEVPCTTAAAEDAAESPQTSHTEPMGNNSLKLTYSGQSRAPTAYVGTASMAVAGSEPETPSARDIAHKGPALAFAPEWSHSTAASSTVKMADTAGSSHKAQEPLQAATVSEEGAVGVSAESFPAAGVEADMDTASEDSIHADMETNVKASREPAASISRTGSTANSTPPPSATGGTAFDGLSALANLLASAVGNLSPSPADSQTSSSSPHATDGSTSNDKSSSSFVHPPASSDSPINDNSMDSSHAHSQVGDAHTANQQNLQQAQEAVSSIPPATTQDSWTHSPPSDSWGTPKPANCHPAPAAMTPVPAAAAVAHRQEPALPLQVTSQQNLQQPSALTTALSLPSFPVYTQDIIPALPPGDEDGDPNMPLPPLTIAPAVFPSPCPDPKGPPANALTPSRTHSAGSAKAVANSSASKHAPLSATQSSQARAEAMRTLAERVRGMAAQLDALKKIELPTASPSSSPRRFGRSATFNPQRHSSPATSATAATAAATQGISPATAATVATTDSPQAQPNTPSEAAEMVGVQGRAHSADQKAGTGPQVADAVQRINRATSDLSLSSHRPE